MNAQKPIRLLMACVLALGASAAFAQVIVAPMAPPALRAEPMPPARAGYTWDPGHWRWVHGRYVWVAGRWQGVRRDCRWMPGRWVARGPNWRWVPGRWLC